jgi:DNA-binding NarL/FixJ family response regulator
MPATSKIIWSDEENADLIKMRLAKFTNQEIAYSVNRPRSTVQQHLVFLMGKMKRRRA